MALAAAALDDLLLRIDLGRPLPLDRGRDTSSSSLESANRLLKKDGPPSSSSLESAKRLALLRLPFEMPDDLLLADRRDLLASTDSARRDWRMRPAPKELTPTGVAFIEVRRKAGGDNERRLKRPLPRAEGDGGSWGVARIDILNPCSVFELARARLKLLTLSSDPLRRRLGFSAPAGARLSAERLRLWDLNGSALGGGL